MARLVQNTVAEVELAPLTLAQLEDALRQADPTALVVSPRLVRRVIKEHTGVGGIGVRVPHRKTYVIAREALLGIVDRADLDLADDAPLAERVILIARPSAEALATLEPGQTLLKFWRQLFHARVHLALERAVAAGRLGAAEVRARVRQIGTTEFEEIRSVLRQDEFLLPPRDDLAVYMEFVAVYLELRQFVPSFLHRYFPSLLDLPAIDELLRQDIDGERLAAATRLPGASDPSALAESPTGHRVPPADRVDEPQPMLRPRRVPAHQRSQRAAMALMHKADRVGQLGNLVRAAILRARAARIADHELAITARDKARSELGRLARRLQLALGFGDNEAEEWTRSLISLLEQSARGIWTAEARMLYDLQKVCIDHERGVYTLDVLGWVLSFGRKSLKRLLPGQRDVLISKHLRSALRRLPSAALTSRARSRLSALVQLAVHRAETNLRARFRPLVERALDQVRLLPQNPPERVARDKLVDEILDCVVERGFLSMGDLRDALSRNNLKLPDLTSLREFLLGDQLLQADRQLAESLDGVYRGGEVYRRWPQRLSSLAFGTPAGRFFTRYAALPFGGAFLALEGLQHIVLLMTQRHEVDDVASKSHELHLANVQSVLILGMFLLGLLHYQRFRVLCVWGLVRAGRTARSVVVDLPAWLMRLPLVRIVVKSWAFRVFQRYLFKPLVISVLLIAGLALFAARELSLQRSLAIFFVVNLLVNSRFGRNVDEMITDWVVLTWHRIRIHIFATMFRFIMDLFHRILETIERLLYTVDEWLRFRVGERALATSLKAVLGFVWFFVNYVIRFCVNLVIEPQVNPIKHFPVVTVSHKLLAPVFLALKEQLVVTLGTAWAWVIAVGSQFLFPGIFGFLVWELKENWRLYAANRPANLLPVAIGHHGETMIQFLRPGFRSGTIPKLYAKLRRSSRKAYWTHNWKASSKCLDGLHHVSESVRRFVDRELLTVLHDSRGWADQSIASGEIRLGCNRILIELYCPELAEESMWLAFEEQAGWLVASIHRRGWSDGLSYARRQALASALAGFYKMAGVDLVREQIESRLEAGSDGYEITATGLVVWPGRDEPKRVYPLGDWQMLEERAEADAERTADRDRWVFAAAPISWRRWVVTWELDQLGGTSRHLVLDNLSVLPS